MKWTLLALVGLGGLTMANPVPAEPCTPGGSTISCPTKTLDVQTDFDDLPAGSTIEQPYQHLSFFNLTVQDARGGSRTRGIKPHSKPNYAVSGPYPTPLTPAPYWTIRGTETTSFDMHEMWAGCVTANGTKNGYTATKCQFTIVCYTAVGRGREGPVLVTYTPSGPTGAKMMNVFIDFAYCTTFSTSLYTSDAGTASTLFVVDSLSYTIREGEVFNDT
ncbi:MAG: hypothetical protein Q9217_001326 [Psora testacea]